MPSQRRSAAQTAVVRRVRERRRRRRWRRQRGIPRLRGNASVLRERLGERASGRAGVSRCDFNMYKVLFIHSVARF